MQFSKNTSSGKMSIVGMIVKIALGLSIIVGLFLFINTIDFPTPKKAIEKIIPNENFKIVK